MTTRRVLRSAIVCLSPIALGSTCGRETDPEASRLPPADPEVDAGAGRTLYRVETETHRATIVLRDEPYRDAMSGWPYEATVSMSLDGREYRGVRSMAVSAGVFRGLTLLAASLSLPAGCGHGPGISVDPGPERRVVPVALAAAETVVPVELVETSWRLVLIDGQEPDPALPDLTLTFEPARAQGSGGCNWYTAWLERAGAVLSVSHLAATTRDCAHPRIMDLESRYLAALEGIETYRLEGDRLFLTGASGGRLEFRRG